VSMMLGASGTRPDVASSLERLAKETAFKNRLLRLGSTHAGSSGNLSPMVPRSWTRRNRKLRKAKRRSVGSGLSLGRGERMSAGRPGGQGSKAVNGSGS